MIRELARMLGIRDDQVDDAVRSEKGAHAVLSRRALFLGAGAIAIADVLPRERSYFLFLNSGGKLIAVRERVHQPFYDTLVHQFYDTSGLLEQHFAFGLFDR